jgi:hypothetical protein
MTDENARRRSRRNNHRTFHWLFHWLSWKTRRSESKKAKQIMVGPGVVPRQSKINNFNCQTDLTAAMGAKGIFLHCQTGKFPIDDVYEP